MEGYEKLFTQNVYRHLFNAKRSVSLSCFIWGVARPPTTKRSWVISENQKKNWPQIFRLILQISENGLH